MCLATVVAIGTITGCSKDNADGNGSTEGSVNYTIDPNPEAYIDLGLPSGTKWKNSNENVFYDYDSALETFGNQLPTQEQFIELKDNCSWN